MSTRIRTGFCAGVAMLIAMYQSAVAGALLPAPELRLATSYRDVSDVYLFAAAWQVKAPSCTRASRMEVAAGLVDGSGRARPFISWRLNRSETPVLVELGFSPAVLGGSTLGTHDLGGNLHFASSLALGRDFERGRLARVALRIQHLSNGGLHDANPGLDLIGLDFISRFDTSPGRHANIKDDWRGDYGNPRTQAHQPQAVPLCATGAHRAGGKIDRA